MTLPVRVNTAEEIPEGLEDHYQEADGGGFEIALNGVKEHSKVTSLANAYESEQDRRKKLSQQLQQFGDLTPEDVEELKGELEEAREGGDIDVDAKIEEAKEAVASKYEDELEDLKQERDRYKSGLHERTVEREIDRAIEDAGVLDEYKPAVRAMLRERDPTMVEQDGEMQGVFEQTPDGIPGKVGIREYVEQWTETDEASPYLPASGKSGSGAEPTGGGSGGGGGAASETVQAEGSTVTADPEKVLSGEQAVQTAG